MQLACALLFATVAFAQAPTDNKPATVEGKVVNAITGEAIRKADLVLTTDITPEGFGDMAAQFGLDTGAASAAKPKEPKRTFSASSDASGKFHFDQIVPGDYFFTIKHAGFVDLTYRGAGPNRAADVLFHLKSGQEVHDLELRLVPQGAAVGRVVDEDGDPVAGAMVTASAVSYMSGHRTLQLHDSGTTDDRGEFRLGKLPPGRYYIAADRMDMNPMATPPPPPADGSPETAYVCTYYPKAIDSAEAEAVEVKAGVDVPGLTIQLQKSRVVRVKGTAIGADGKPLKGAQVMLMAAGRPFSMRMVMVNNPEGKFELANVEPGSYNVMVMQLADQKMVMQTLFVPAENLSDVKLGTVPEGTVQGRVNLTGDGKVTLKGLSVELQSDEDALVMPVTGITDDLGAFALKKVTPARYEVKLQNVPAGAYLKSVLWNGKEKLGEGFDFAIGSAADLQMLLGTDGGAFDAVVSRDEKPLSDATVVLLPADASRRNEETARSETADDTGHAAFKDVPPGDYLAIAWEAIDEGEWFDPARVKAAERNIVKVTIGQKDSQHAELKAVAK